MGFARLGGQGLTQRIGPFRLLKLAAVVAAGGALIAAAAWTPAMAYAGFIVLGVGASVVVPTAFSLVGQLGPDAARARAIARATLLGYFGFFFGPPALGLIAGHLGLRYAFVFAAVLLLTLLILAPMMAAAGARRPEGDQRA
jgi:MFS family permease